MIDVARLRRQFPVTERYVYLNHAGLSPVPTSVTDAVTRSVASQAEHGLARVEEWEAGVERVRQQSARLMGCGPDEVAFVRNTSHGLSLIAAGLDWRAGDNVLCAVAEEYPSNIYPWEQLASRGVELRAVPAPAGVLDPRTFAEAGDARTRVVTVSSVQYASGFRVDLEALGAVCAERGWLLVVDGIQSLGAIPCDVKRAKVAALSADSHKWMLGLPGVGVMYVDRALCPRLTPALVGWRSTVEALNFDQAKLVLRDDARRFEEGNLQYALIEGMGASIDLLLGIGVDAVWERIRALNDHLVDGLIARGHAVTSPMDETHRSGSVTFTPRVEAAGVAFQRLNEAGIVTSLRRGAIRVSPHVYNTVEELERVLAVLDRGRG